MQNLKVWEGLAALDRAERQVRAGTYEQSAYRFVKAVAQLQEATPLPIEQIQRPLTDYDPPNALYEMLSAKLKELKF